MLDFLKKYIVEIFIVFNDNNKQKEDTRCPIILARIADLWDTFYGINYLKQCTKITGF